MKKARIMGRKALSGSDMPEWERQFTARCDGEQVAVRALERLEVAHLGAPCRRLLFEYSRGDNYFAEIQNGTGLLDANFRAFERAERVLKARSHDPRALLFRQRFESAARVLMETPWPFHHPLIRAFGNLYSLAPSTELFEFLLELRKNRSLIGRGKLSWMLAMLRSGAQAHGVSLSGNELAALAYCASGQELDGGAVRRILRQPRVAAAELGYRTVFENFYCCACLQQL